MIYWYQHFLLQFQYFFVIFDFYENKKVNEIKVGIRFTFQSNFNTLSEDEIQKSVNKLLKPIVDIEGVSIPGL